MKRQSRILAAAATLLTLAVPAVGGVPVAQNSQATPGHEATTAARVAAKAAELKAAADAGDTHRLVTRTRAVLRDTTLPAAEREALLANAALALRRVKPDAATRALAEELLKIPAGDMVWHGEGHHRVLIPRYEVAAAAASAKAAWQRQSAQSEAAARLAAGPAAFVELFDHSPLPAATLAGIEGAFRSADAGIISLWRDALLHALPANRQLDTLAAIAAERLADGALYDALFEFAAAQTVIASFSAVHESMHSLNALGLFSRAAQRRELASASLLHIGLLAAHDAAATDYLFAALADPAHGGSAAAALASLRDAAITRRLAAMLEQTRDENLRRRTVLALRLTDSPLAREVLDLWRAAPAQSAGAASLKAEMAEWRRR